MARRTSPVLSIIIGLAGIGIAIYFYVTQTAFLAKCLETTGTVIEIDRTTKHDSKNHNRTTVTWRPVIQFVVGQSNYRFKSYDSTKSGSEYRVGQTLPILYNRDNPADAQIKEKADFKVSLIAGAIGICALFWGIFSWRRAKNDTTP